MEKNKIEDVIKKLQDAVDRLNNKTFNVYFFVIDTKGAASGSLAYIYETAYQLSKMGYKVTMLHQEVDEFIGVGEWLGEKYSMLPHANIQKDKVDVSPCDFLIIPEIFANVMVQTKKLPCRRIALLQNYNYLSEFIPIGTTWGDMGIYDVITTTNKQAEMAKEIFPNITTHIVRPSISPIFRNSDKPKKLIINIIARDQSDVNKIVKPFYWKNPIYKWVSFRDLRGMSRAHFAEALRDGAITVWVDPTTNFGYSPLEAMRSGSIVVAKLPDDYSDWNIENGNLTNSCLWFDNINDVHKLLAGLIKAWTYDEIPNEVYTNMEKMNNIYSTEEQNKDIETVYVNTLFNQRKLELNALLSQFKNKTIKENKE